MKGRDALGTERMTALADRVEFNPPEMLACEQAGVIPLVTKQLSSNSKVKVRFDKRDFFCDLPKDEYEYLVGERAIHGFASDGNGLTLHKYWWSACPRCQ